MVREEVVVVVVTQEAAVADVVRATSFGNLRSGVGETLRAVWLIVVASHAEEAEQVPVLVVELTVLNCVVTHPQLGRTSEDDDVLFVARQCCLAIVLYVVQSVVIVFDTHHFPVGQIAGPYLVVGSAHLVFQPNASPVPDGIHQHRTCIGAFQNEAAAMGHQEVVVDLQHGILPSSLRADVGGTRKADVGIVDQDDTTTLDGGQRTGGRGDLIICHDAVAIGPDKHLAARGTRFTKLTAAIDAASDIHIGLARRVGIHVVFGAIDKRGTGSRDVELVPCCVLAATKVLRAAEQRATDEQFGSRGIDSRSVLRVTVELVGVLSFRVAWMEISRRIEDSFLAHHEANRAYHRATCACGIHILVDVATRDVDKGLPKSFRNSCFAFFNLFATAENAAFDVAAAHVHGLQALVHDIANRFVGDLCVAAAKHVAFHRAAVDVGHALLVDDATVAAAKHVAFQRAVVKIHP